MKHDHFDVDTVLKEFNDVTACTKHTWKIKDGDCKDTSLTCKELVNSTIVSDNCVADLTKAQQLHT